MTIVGDAGPLMGAAAQPRRLAVLALLTRAGERGMTRDKIAACLWPDADEERARTNLSKVLYSVRRDLGADDIVVGSKDLRLNPNVVETDLTDFERAVAEGELERAAAVYEGPFLDGFRLPGATEFDRWVDGERTALRHDYEVVLEKLARRAAERGDPKAAVQWWRTLASQDPLNARHALGLMRALEAAGDRAGAIQHARIYETLVQQELDLPPDREVVALAQQLRQAPGPSSAPNADSVAVEGAPASTRETVPASVNTSVDVPVNRPALAPAPPIAVAPPTGQRRRSISRGAIVFGAALAIVAAAVTAMRVRFGAPRPDDLPVVALGLITDYRDSTRAELARSLTDMLATSLGRLAGAQVVSTARMYELLSQADNGGDTSAAALVAAARRAGATELVDGALYAVDGGRMRLDLRRVELATGRMRVTHSVTGTSLIELADSGTLRLAADLRAGSPAGSIGDVTTRSMAAYQLYEQGLRAYYQRDMRSANRFFDAALAEDSTFAMAAYYSGLSTSDRAQSLARLARAARLAAHATDRERLTILAQLTYLRDEPALRAVAETLVVRYPHEVEGYFFLGTSLQGAGEFMAAIPYFNRVVAMDSLALGGARARCVACDALKGIVSAYYQADSLAAAEREARRWLRLQPRSAAAWRVLGDVLESAGRPAESMAARRSEARIDPPSVVTDVGDGTFRRFYAGDYDEAERVLLQHVKGVVPAEEIEAQWFLTLTYRQQGRLAAALVHARRFRALGAVATAADAAPSAALQEAQVLLEMRRWREAAALFDSIARLRTADEVPAHTARYEAWAKTHAANALAALGDTAGLAGRADSVQALGARTLFGRDERLHHHVRGLLLAARGRDDDAIAELREAIFSPNTGYTRTNYELGRLYLRRGRAREALGVLQPALRGPIEAGTLYVTRTELHELLAEAWETLGGPASRDSAAAHWAAVQHAWKRADPMFAGRVRRAADRLDALRAR